MSTLYLCPEPWLHTCDMLLRQGALERLQTHLHAPPTEACRPAGLFYTARLHLDQGHYIEAATLFNTLENPLRRIGDFELVQQTRIWLACCQMFCGDYTTASSMLDQVANSAPPESLVYAYTCLVDGMIKEASATLTEAQESISKAHRLALAHRDRWLEVCCCTILASLYTHLGRMDQAGLMIQRVIQLHQTGNASPQQVIQARTINIHRLRFKGELAGALQLGFPLDPEGDKNRHHWHGWLALSTAMAATDTGDFDLAHQSWHYAMGLLASVQSNLSQAQLFWERAWLCFCQGDFVGASQDNHQAHHLLVNQTGVAHNHALVIAALIEHTTGSSTHTIRRLDEACKRFRAAHHHVGLASALLHRAAHHLQNQNLILAATDLCESFAFLWQHHLYGTCYWHAPTMARLCLFAITESWPSPPPWETHPELARIFGLHANPQALLGDFAAGLVASRLSDHWQAFAHLLTDERPQVRRRAAQILAVAQPRYPIPNLTLLPRPSPENIPVAEDHIAIRSFGHFNILVRGQPLRLEKAGTKQARVIVGTLLLADQEGVKADELCFLLWPTRMAEKQRQSLQSVISSLRRVLRPILNQDPISFDLDSQRYFFHWRQFNISWDWDQLRRLATSSYPGELDEQRRLTALSLYHPDFMGDLFTTLKKPKGLLPPTDQLWAEAVDEFQQQADRYGSQARHWLEQLGVQLEEDSQ